MLMFFSVYIFFGEIFYIHSVVGVVVNYISLIYGGAM